MPINWLSSYMTLSYQNRGRGKSVDCWGLVRRIYSDRLGVDLPNMDGYTDSEDEDQAAAVIAKEAEQHWDRVDIPKAYDVVVFKLKNKPNHVGLMIDSETFIHALEGRGVTLGALSEFLWRNRIDDCYRLRRGAV